MKACISTLFGALCAFCLGACVSTSHMSLEPAMSNGSMGAFELLQARLAQATDEALQIVRYNPATCRCPPFEILLSDHWHRVDLAVSDVDNPILGQLLRLTSDERAEEALKHYRLTGTFESTLQECGRGLPMVTFRPLEFQGVDAPQMEGTQPRPTSPEEPRETPEGSEQEQSHSKRVILPLCG